MGACGFLNGGGEAPWDESFISVALVKVWKYNDPGDIHGILTEDIPSNMDEKGIPSTR